MLCFLADNRIQLGVRVREGPERGELSWRRPSRVGVQNMLRNPAYAGIYAYGRSRVDPRRRQAGRPFTGRVRTAREDWIVFLPGLLPAVSRSLLRAGPDVAALRATAARLNDELSADQ